MDVFASPNSPSFLPLFKAGAYNYLLGARPDMEPRYRAVASCLERSGSQTVYEIGQMLGSINWRWQIIGVVATIVARPVPENVEAVWKAIDQASWVSPQLAAAARQIDPDFQAAALTRLQALGEYSIDLEQFSAEEGELRTGLLSSKAWRGKTLASLAALLAGLDRDAELVKILEDPTLQDLLAADSDGGARIAMGWYAGSLELVQAIALSAG